MNHTLDSYVSFADPNSFPSFKSFQSSAIPQDDPFKVDQRDIDESLTKKVKRTKNNDPVAQCDLCSVPISSDVVYQIHINGKKHQTHLKTRLTKDPQYKTLTYDELCSRKIEVNESEKPIIATEPEVIKTAAPLIPSKQFFCHLCIVTCNSQQMYDNHIRGKKHITKSKSNQLNSAPIPTRPIADNKPSSSNYCDLCSIRFDNENNLTEHLSQKEHQVRVKEPELPTKEVIESDPSGDDEKISSSSNVEQKQTSTTNFSQAPSLNESSAPPIREKQVSRGGAQRRGAATMKRGQTNSYARPPKRPSDDSHRYSSSLQWNETVPATNSDIFGAFSRDNEQRFGSENSSSHVQPNRLANYNNRFPAKRARPYYNNAGQNSNYNYAGPSSNYQPSPSAWQYQQESYYNAPPTNYTPPSPLPNQPPLPNYPPNYPQYPY